MRVDDIPWISARRAESRDDRSSEAGLEGERVILTQHGIDKHHHDGFPSVRVDATLGTR